MAKIPEEVVESVVSDVSKRMASDPTYSQVAIGSFAQAHPDASRFITAHLDDLGGGEGVMHAVFHAQVLNECFERHFGRVLTPIDFVDLDKAAHGDPIEKLLDRQPGLASYVASNVDEAPLKRLVSLLGVAMDRQT